MSYCLDLALQGARKRGIVQLYGGAVVDAGWRVEKTIVRPQFHVGRCGGAPGFVRAI